MKRISNLISLLAVVVIAASCSASRAEKMKMAENVKVDCEPEVLALVGDKIPAEISVSYPDGYFHPKVVMEVTPVLVYEGGEKALEPFTYQGDKVKDNHKVVSSKGGTVKEKFAFEYVPGVEKSYLELRSVVYYGSKQIVVPAIKVADGVNTTQMLAHSSGEYSFKKDNYQEVLHEKAEGQIMYAKNSAQVKSSELRSESIKELQAALEEIAGDPRYTVKGTKVIAYASPEGGQSLNAKLSDKRASSASKVWNKVTGMQADQLEVQSVGQDWEGFQEAVSNSSIEDKELILRVLSMYSDPAVRENEIRNMSQVYTEINKNVFPELRRARLIAEVDYQNFSDAELEELANKAIDLLDEEGLLRVAANANTAERKESLYKTAVSKYGSDRANFNLAVLSLNAGQPEVAQAYLSGIRKSDDDVVNAKGVCELQKGNLDAAAALFRQSSSAEAAANLGTVALLKGNYAEAARILAPTEGKNKALALLLDGQLDKASAAITCKCPKSNYLRAIIAARKGDAQTVKTCLEAASAKESLKERSEKDVEFADFR